jgi:hypothetical protein
MPFIIGQWAKEDAPLTMHPVTFFSSEAAARVAEELRKRYSVGTQVFEIPDPRKANINVQ